VNLDTVVDTNIIQADNWHELFAFVRDMRNQLECARPFADNVDEHMSTSNAEPFQRKYSNVDEGIILINRDNQQYSSASSLVSSEELENSSTSSNSTSFDTIKDELKYHYYGLLTCMDRLTSVANRVTEKYREQATF
jgi:hypothetical protein